MRWVRAAIAAALLLGVAFVVAQPSAAAQVVVSITADGFEPADVTVTEADEILFCNDDTVNHRAVADNGAFDTGVLEPDDCDGGEPPEIGTYPYSDGGSLHGVLRVVAAPTTTTTTTPPPPPPTTTTTRRTTTTARRVTTTRATSSTSTSSTVASTTSSLDTTTTSEVGTSTTFGQFAIETADKGNDGFKIAVVISAAVALVGIGYLVYRWRFARSRY